MSEPIKLRASSLPLAFVCPGSVRPARTRIDAHNPAGTLGTAIHEALEPLARGGAFPWADLPDLAARYGVGLGELRALGAAGVRLWEDVRGSFIGAMTEVGFRAELDGCTLTGHADLLSIAVDVARVGDWKSGRKDADYSQQLRGYAALTLLHAEHLREATATALWLRTREIENYTMTRDGLAQWLEELRAIVVRWDGTYHPGGHCPQYCQRAHECEAARQYASAAVAIVTDRALVGRLECEIEAFGPDELIALKKKASMVSAFAARVEDAIRDRVLREGEVIGSDERLTVEVSQKRHINPLVAWPVLEAAGFDDEDMAAVISMSGSAIDRRVSARTPRGAKGAAIKRLTAQLEEAGAITHDEQHRVTLRRI